MKPPHIPLDPADRRRLATLGWPRPLPQLERRADAVYSRKGDILVGTLTFLQAFAKIEQGARKVDLARDDVGFVVIGGKPIPDAFARLPNDSDAVVLENGEILTGYVNVDRLGVHIAGRTFLKERVSLIHLKGAAETQYPDIEEPDNADEGGAPPKPGETPTDPRAGKRHAGRGPAEIPWGQAIWRGTLAFERMVVDAGGEPIRNQRGSYYVTWSEEVTVRSGGSVLGIQLRPLSLVYQYSESELASSWLPHSCQPFTITKQGSGVDLVLPSSHSTGVLILPPTLDSTAGTYLIHLYSPDSITLSDIPSACDLDVRRIFFASANYLPYFDLYSDNDPITFRAGAANQNCTKVPRAPPPYTSIAGEYTCGERGQPGSAYVHWQFERGALPAKISPDPCSACSTARGRRDLERDNIKRLLHDIDQLKDGVKGAQNDLDRINRAKAPLHDYMGYLLIAAASQDVGKRLLDIVASDGAAQVSGALEQEKQTANILAAVAHCLSDAMDGVGGMSSEDPDNVIKTLHAPAKAIRSCAGAGLGENGDESPLTKLISAAREEFELGQVLADAIGLGSGEAEAEYIKDHLGQLGPLVPPEVLQKVDMYLKLTEQWSERQREIQKMVARIKMDGFALADHGIALKTLEQRLGRCRC